MLSKGKEYSLSIIFLNVEKLHILFLLFWKTLRLIQKGIMGSKQRKETFSFWIRKPLAVAERGRPTRSEEEGKYKWGHQDKNILVGPSVVGPLALSHVTFRIRIRRRRRRGARWERRGAETCVRFDSPSAVSFHYSFNNFKLFLEFKLCYQFIIYFQFGNYRNYRNQ